MDHHDHVNLLKPAHLSQGIYADFGAGRGAFTLALREVLGDESTIYAVDKDGSALKELSRLMPGPNLILLADDFSKALSLPPLDGIIAANSLHYFKDRVKILKHVRSYLKPAGKLIVIEYNVDSGNMWVPYPFAFGTFQRLAVDAGFSQPRLLARAPSNFLSEFYSAQCINAE